MIEDRRKASSTIALLRSVGLFVLLMVLSAMVAPSAMAAPSSVPDPGTVQTNGQILAVAVTRDTIFLGGFFTQDDGQPRNRLAAVDTTTGELTNWNPNANDRVFALAVSPDGTRVYAGGAFSNVGG